MIEVPTEDLTSEMIKNMTHEELKAVSLEVFEDLIDDVVLGLCFEVHRAVKIGMLFLDESQDDEKYEIVDEIGLDVFGQVPLKKQFECVCPNCQRNLAASRFAPHLEKCMGMGRNSSRLASKRIANSGKTESDIDDYDNDSDWNYNPDKKSSKKRKDKNSPRRSTKTKTKNGEGISGGSTSDGNVFANYEAMSVDEKKALLMQMCGVISEHTKKMCTRSHRCPQHTDAQRKNVRVQLLGQHGNSLPDTSDDVQIDIDTYDEGDSQALRESMTRLWDPANSTVPSPADSTSTNNSTASTTKKKKEKANAGSSNRGAGGSKKGKSRPPQGSTSSTSSSVSSSGQGSIELA